MYKLKQTRKYKNSFLNWIEYRLPIISYIEKEYGKYPMPKNANYFWSFGAILTIVLVVISNLLPSLRAFLIPRGIEIK